jgi:hypothetical protein
MNDLGVEGRSGNVSETQSRFDGVNLIMYMYLMRYADG